MLQRIEGSSYQNYVVSKTDEYKIKDGSWNKGCHWYLQLAFAYGEDLTEFVMVDADCFGTGNSIRLPAVDLHLTKWTHENEMRKIKLNFGKTLWTLCAVVFLNRRALALIIPDRETFSWNLPF